MLYKEGVCPFRHGRGEKLSLAIGCHHGWESANPFFGFRIMGVRLRGTSGVGGSRVTTIVSSCAGWSRHMRSGWVDGVVLLKRFLKYIERTRRCTRSLFDAELMLWFVYGGILSSVTTNLSCCSGEVPLSNKLSRVSCRTNCRG